MIVGDNAIGVVGFIVNYADWHWLTLVTTIAWANIAFVEKNMPQIGLAAVHGLPICAGQPPFVWD